MLAIHLTFRTLDCCQDDIASSKHSTRENGALGWLILLASIFEKSSRSFTRVKSCKKIHKSDYCNSEGSSWLGDGYQWPYNLKNSPQTLQQKGGNRMQTPKTDTLTKKSSVSRHMKIYKDGKDPYPLGSKPCQLSHALNCMQQKNRHQTCLPGECNT